MKQMLTFLAAGLSIAACASAQAQAQTQPGQVSARVDGPLLSFNIVEEVRARPDEATVGAGVTSMAPTAVEAMRANAAAMEKLIAAAKKAGIKPEHIQTSGLSLSPRYDYNDRGEGQPPRFLGYQVSNNVRAKSTDIAGIGPLLDSLVAAGGTNIEGPWFSLSDPDAKLAGIRGAAIKAAEAKAADYARLAGFRGAELVSISEGGGFSGPQPPMPMARMEMGGDAKSTPIEPGQVGNSLTLSFQYRLLR